MSIKLLFFPFAIIVTLYLAIAHIWPGFTVISQKRAEIAEKQAELERIQQKRMSLESLLSAMDSQTANREMVFRYMPEHKAEEVVLNDANLLTQQDQLGIFTVSYEKFVAPRTRRSADEERASVKSESVNGKFVITGSYPQIKSYLDKHLRTERSKTLTSLSIAKISLSDNTETEGVAQGDAPLEASVTYGYQFLPPLQKTTIEHPIFDQGSFQFSALDEIRAERALNLSPLRADSAGRTNPFTP